MSSAGDGFTFEMSCEILLAVDESLLIQTIFAGFDTADESAGSWRWWLRSVVQVVAGAAEFVDDAGEDAGLEMLAHAHHVLPFLVVG